MSNVGKCILSLFLAFNCYGGQPLIADYSILKIGFHAITTDGKIDFQRWQRWDYKICEPVSIDKFKYDPIENMFFVTYSPETHPNAYNQEQTRRYEQELNAAKDMSIIGGRVHYQGRKLKYPERVRNSNRPWGKTVWDEPPQAFRFGDYLIFMVRVRVYFRINPYDIIVYDLKTDTYASCPKTGAWPAIEVYRPSEAVQDPRAKSQKP